MNTVVRRHDGKLVGYNTDCDGALSAIEDGLLEAGTAHQEVYNSLESGHQEDDSVIRLGCTLCIVMPCKCLFQYPLKVRETQK